MALPLTLSGSILADDHAAAALVHGRVSPGVWIAFWSLTGVFLVSGVIQAIGISSKPNPTIFLIAGAVATFPISRKLGLQMRARRLFAETRARAERTEFVFSETGIVMNSSRGTGNPIAWSELHKWRAGPEHILLYLNSAIYLIVPKRFFPDATAITELEAKLASAVGRSA